MTNGKEIHNGFTREGLLGKTYKQKGEELGFTCQDAQEGIGVGFRPQEYRGVKQGKDNNFLSGEVKHGIRNGLDKGDCRFATYLRNKGYHSALYLSIEQIEQLSREFHTGEESQKLIQYQQQPPK